MKCAAISDASCSSEAGSSMCCAATSDATSDASCSNELKFNWNQCYANTGKPFSAGSFEPGIGTVAPARRGYPGDLCDSRLGARSEGREVSRAVGGLLTCSGLYRRECAQPLVGRARTGSGR